eukprot:TRINITY_DN3229_c0_g1_i1.p1 TRINITY_DN3229_c0_g1~~TRINITY_DN3229_c0_g1_i1.p1  ORF type:complete len:391 (+),score=63.93 TRINITY_DN3229_c0_g1_i1:693-1865(+)
MDDLSERSPSVKRLKTEEEEDPNEEHEKGFQAALGRVQPPSRREQVSVPVIPSGPHSEKLSLSDLRQRIGNHTWEQVRELVSWLSLRRQQQTLQLTMYYMWRFYMGYEGGDGDRNDHHHPRNYDRRVMMCACLFLAAKVEDSLFTLGDLVIKAWGHEPQSSDYQARKKQIHQAELYLVAVMLRFNFTYKLPASLMLDKLQQLTGCHVRDFIHGREGIPWCIAAYKLTTEVYRTPICVTYTSQEIALGVLVLCKSWVTGNPWEKLDGKKLHVDSKWDERFSEETNTPRIIKIRKEMEQEFSMIGIGPETVERTIAKIITRQQSSSVAHGVSPPPARPTPFLGSMSVSKGRPPVPLPVVQKPAPQEVIPTPAATKDERAHSAPLPAPTSGNS